jgi:hypothetical protein
MNFFLLATVLATGNIAVSAQITNTKTVSVYVSNGAAITTVRNGGTSKSNQPLPFVPLIAVSFEEKKSGYFVRHVTLDKAHHLLTIDF